MDKHIATVEIEIGRREATDLGRELQEFLINELHLIYRQDFFWYSFMIYGVLHFDFYGDTEKEAVYFALKFGGRPANKKELY